MVERQHLQEASKKIIHALLADLKTCSRTKSLETGKKVHAEAVKCGLDSNIYVGSALINMYGKCGSMVDAGQVFEGLEKPNVVSWNALILGYAANEQAVTALQLFTRMKTDGPAPNAVTFMASIKACTSLAEECASRWVHCSNCGKVIQNLAIENGCGSHVYVQNTLIGLYGKCSSIVEAVQLFSSMKHPDVVSWNTLLWVYAETGQGLTALELFMRMGTDGPAPDYVTFAGALKACISCATKCTDKCTALHNLAIENGCSAHIYVQNSLIGVYAKCGSMERSRHVFQGMKHTDVLSWTVLISGYAENGQGLSALELFTRMKTEGPAPDYVTFVGALKASTSLAVEGERGWTDCRNRGKALHNLATENGCGSQIYLQNSLIDMFVKCGSMVDAHQEFDSIKHPNVVCWTALILGYTENGQSMTALELFARMKTGGPAPNAVTYSVALKACALLGALEYGRKIHLEIDNWNGFDVVLVNCLVDFYAKCGSLAEAQGVFDVHSETRDMITWNSLLAGFSNCGDIETVFKLFQGMQDAGFLPDGVTFLCILTCCSHAGLLVKGKDCFDAMSTKYEITPTLEHYNCMVDIFGRANKLDDAMALLQFMPCCPNDVTWMTILDACRKWNNEEIGWKAFQSLINSSDSNSGYVPPLCFVPP